MSRLSRLQIYWNSPASKALILAAGASIAVYVAAAISIYLRLEAGRPTPANPHPADMTGFPAYLAFAAALYYGIPTLIAVFILAVIPLSIADRLRRRRDTRQNI